RTSSPGWGVTTRVARCPTSGSGGASTTSNSTLPLAESCPGNAATSRQRATTANVMRRVARLLMGQPRSASLEKLHEGLLDIQIRSKRDVINLELAEQAGEFLASALHQGFV